jgi:hypothetical protein
MEALKALLAKLENDLANYAAVQAQAEADQNGYGVAFTDGYANGLYAAISDIKAAIAGQEG